jgi:uncharacterized protein YbaP (TraB family)
MPKVPLMKKTVAFLVILAAGISQLFAQAPKSSLLWEISGKGLKAPSYIFGTFHMICKSDFTISEALKNKIKSTQQFYGELDMGDLAGMQMQMAMKMIMKDKTIESMMSPEEYRQMSDAFLKETNMPFSMFNRFKPFMGQSVLAMSMIACEDKIQPETEFAKIATDNKIAVRGLETLDDELNAIDKIPLDSQVNDLKNMLLHFDSAKLEMQQMVTLYKKRNIDSLYAFITKSMNGSSTEKELLITRNKNWFPVIVKAMNERPSFFAVGAGHLGGQTGVLNLLRKQGYKITAVTF